MTRAKELGVPDHWMKEWPDTGKGRALAIESWLNLKKAVPASTNGSTLEDYPTAWGDFPPSIVFEHQYFHFENHAGDDYAFYSCSIGAGNMNIKSFSLKEAKLLAIAPQAKTLSIEELEKMLGAKN